MLTYPLSRLKVNSLRRFFYEHWRLNVILEGNTNTLLHVINSSATLSISKHNSWLESETSGNYLQRYTLYLMQINKTNCFPKASDIYHSTSD